MASAPISKLYKVSWLRRLWEVIKTVGNQTRVHKEGYILEETEGLPYNSLEYKPGISVDFWQVLVLNYECRVCKAPRDSHKY